MMNQREVVVLPSRPAQIGPCSICHNVSGNKTFAAREMMFGYRDKFDYLECNSCGCLQLQCSPKDLERYYPSNYFPNPRLASKRASLKSFLRRQRAKYCLEGSGLLGRLLVKKWGRPKSSIFGRPDYYQWLARCGIGFSSKILEVGCGSGVLLLQMQDDGFTDLTGVDPFIDETVTHSEVLRILKDEIYNLSGAFDLIMLHHTFEHMPEPAKVLQQLHRLLNHERYVLIRIPVAGSFAYRTYGANWAQLDAPRHLFLHTLKSMEILANDAGFEIADVVFDSDDFQFWASQQYMRDIPLKDRNSYAVNPERSLFSREQINTFKERASELNAKNDGDSACFYLFKA